VNILLAFTLLALHLATPHKLAPAALVLDPDLGVETAAAAEEAAAVPPSRFLVALPASGTHHSSLRIVRTVVRTGLDVHQGLLGHRQRVWSSLGASPVSVPNRGINLVVRHLNCGFVVLPLEIVSNLGEGRETAPAGLELAAAGDPVAPALHQHQSADRPSPGLVVVEVHQVPDLALLLDEPAVRRVQELPRELQPELQVVTAAAPLPSLGRGVPLAVQVTVALRQVPRAAGLRHHVYNPGACHRVQEGSLLGPSFQGGL